jgi:hypothetical protein
MLVGSLERTSQTEHTIYGKGKIRGLADTQEKLDTCLNGLIEVLNVSHLPLAGFKSTVAKGHLFW